VCVAAALSATACASLSRGTEAPVAVTSGAAVADTGGPIARAAIMGAVVGGSVGMVIGHQMDQQAKELTLEIPGATVERFGEGILVTLPSGPLYAANSDVILPAATQSLKQLASSMKKYPNTELLIVGHTDERGDAQQNEDLSSRQSSNASRYLSTQGILSDRIHTAGKGASQPLQSTATDEGRRQNRRIEVAIFADQKARTSAP
jgi:outer membrane protein OmpA-like peptidoglycan-associated protein